MPKNADPNLPKGGAEDPASEPAARQVMVSFPMSEPVHFALRPALCRSARPSRRW